MRRRRRSPRRRRGLRSRCGRRRAGSARSGGPASRRRTRRSRAGPRRVSIANTCAAPAASAACTAHRPTGPRPSTATLSPGSHAALGDGVVAGAHHVAGEQRDVVWTCRRGPGAASGSALGTSACSACVPCSEPSAAPWPNVRAALALVVVAAQAEEAGAAGACGSSPSTRSPGATRVTSSPAASTVPTNSWPIVKPGSILHAPVVDVQVRAADARWPRSRTIASSRALELGLGPLVDADLAGRLEGDGSHRLVRHVVASSS